MSRSNAPRPTGAPDAATRAVFSGSPLRSRIVAAVVALGLAISVAWVVIAAVGVGDAPDRLPPRHEARVRELVTSPQVVAGRA